jgi:hypothetical protein
MSAPKRIQRKRTKGWRMPEGAVYVGRPTLWGNPYRVERVPGWPRWGGAPPWRVTGPDGREHWPDTGRRPIVGRVEADAQRHHAALTHAVALYRETLRIFEPDEDDFWTPLAGRDLACWCPLDQPCHADVLLEVANR